MKAALQPNFTITKPASNAPNIVPNWCEVDHKAHFVPLSVLENQKANAFAIPGKPIDWNHPLIPQQRAINKSNTGCPAACHSGLIK